MIMAGRTVDLPPDGDRFGQRRPPLYTIIANILQEYPSGQIFKVNLYIYIIIIIYFFVILQRKIKIAIIYIYIPPSLEGRQGRNIHGSLY